MPASFPINPDQLAAAIIELNSMSRCDGVVMTRQGQIKAGYRHAEDTLCELLPAPQLARMLTADGLSSYTAKELCAWIAGLDVAPLQAKADAAAQTLESE